MPADRKESTRDGMGIRGRRWFVEGHSADDAGGYQLTASGPLLLRGERVEVVEVDPSTTTAAVSPERRRIAALIRDKAEGTWDPRVEAVLRDLAREVADGEPSTGRGAVADSDA